jgi:cysteine-rich repeat protein
MSKTAFYRMVLGMILVMWFCAAGYADICGDGKRQGAEECDNGAENSDSKPDACRTNCMKAKCGDWTKDSNEQCDEGSNNSDLIPNACRRNCRNAYCGDGVLDEGEECDDKNNDPFDGCNQCRRCYQPKDDLSIYGDEHGEARLCPGRFEFQDQGKEGIIILGSNVTLDCQGSTIVETNPIVRAAATAPRVSQAVKQIPPVGIGRAGSRRDKSSTTAKSGSSSSASSSGGSSPPPVAYRHRGTGIVIDGENVVLRNCNVEGFKIGVHVKSVDAVVFDNTMCRNTTDIQADQPGNYGVKNTCGPALKWDENGKPGCSQQCR